MKKFNVTGLCVPDKHYMADTSEKINAIMSHVDAGDYFCINCARQYGKTTTLNLLVKKLSDEYTPIFLSFEGESEKMFDSEFEFCKGFLHICKRALKEKTYQGYKDWEDATVTDFSELKDFITGVCDNFKYILIIDEIDKSSNNLVFIKFLGVLRDKYLQRAAQNKSTFHSVILAGVYDIKNLKIKIAQDQAVQLQDGDARINSPWNIAVDFKVDMSLSVKEISSMLADYENDHHIEMDIETVAKEIRTYTNGYPYLVSRICQKIEDDLDRDWSQKGIERAIKIMLSENSTLIDDIFKNLNNNKELDDLMFSIVAKGEKYTYSAGNITMGLGLTFGFLIKQDTDVIIGNRFFEHLLYNYYALKLEIDRKIRQRTTPSDVVSNGKLNMQLLVEKFARHYYEIYKESLKNFIEDECRILFLTYMQPLINGAGFYHVESETRNAKRMDVIVDYGDEQFIIELKLWYGDVKHDVALDQIVGYLNSKNKDVGYLITFDFRKENNIGAPKMEWAERSGKKIFDVIVGI